MLSTRYKELAGQLAVLDLSLSCSELHGILCGYLCAGAYDEAESYLRALITAKKPAEDVKKVLGILFEIYEMSRQQITAMDFEFELMIPDDDVPLRERALAFSQWCEGFTEGITLAGVDFSQLEEEESQDALKHFFEFAELDYDSLDISDEDEKALVEVNEYARMAVLRLRSDLYSGRSEDSSRTAH